MLTFWSQQVPLADRTVEMCISQFIPRHVRMYAKLFVLREPCKSERATVLVNTVTETWAFQQVDLPGVLM